MKLFKKRSKAPAYCKPSVSGVRSGGLFSLQFDPDGCFFLEINTPGATNDKLEYVRHRLPTERVEKTTTAHISVGLSDEAPDIVYINNEWAYVEYICRDDYGNSVVAYFSGNYNTFPLAGNLTFGAVFYSFDIETGKTNKHILPTKPTNVDQILNNALWSCNDFTGVKVLKSTNGDTRMYLAEDKVKDV